MDAFATPGVHKWVSGRHVLRESRAVHLEHLTVIACRLEDPVT